MTIKEHITEYTTIRIDQFQSKSVIKSWDLQDRSTNKKFKDKWENKTSTIRNVYKCINIIDELHKRSR